MQRAIDEPDVLWHSRLPGLVRPSASLVLFVQGGVAACAVVVGLRRWVLARWEPLELPVTLLAALVVLAILLGCRLATRRSGVELPVGTQSVAFHYVPTAVLVLWAIVCSFPGTQSAAWVIWGAVISIDVVAAHKLFGSSAASPTLQASSDPPEQSDQADDSQAEPSDDAGDSPSSPLGEGEIVLQQVMRIRDEANREYVYATLRGEFAPGERTKHLFVGFCPPFPQPPQVEAEVIDGAGAVAKVVQAVHNGAQIEVDLDEPSFEAAHVIVELAAYVPTEE